jgi:hypothetical protein
MVLVVESKQQYSSLLLILIRRGFIALVVPFLAAYLCHIINPSGLTHVVAWSLVQWIPPMPQPAASKLRNVLQQAAWDYWESNFHNCDGWLQNQSVPSLELDIPTVDVQKHRGELLEYLTQTYGRDWRKRPLLLKGLWREDELEDRSRRLSLEGLLREELPVPYFTDARRKGALTPDEYGSVRDIVRNMTLGKPHKIGTQLLVQYNPQLIQEVAPWEIVTSLFGNYFLPKNVEGSGPFNLFPAFTTVPVFVASHHHQKHRHAVSPNDSGSGSSPSSRDSNESTESQQQPFTALHCEPIGNVAVQLFGQKKWTLVGPEFSFWIKPSVSPDGRAFFASSSSTYSHVPTYSAITAAGDAIWVPTWTWHRVDYIESDDIAIGGSLFHFRAVDFIRNNPLFAVIILPAMVLELVGYNTQ